MICGYQQKRSGADRRDGTRAEGKEEGGRKGNRLDQKKKKDTGRYEEKLTGAAV
jgi:hypothetical protein